MATVRGGPVRTHVQSFVDRCAAATRAESFGTYPGHSPSLDLAVDIFVPVNSVTLGNAITSFAIDNQVLYGMRYIIYRQRIWHRLDQRWAPMDDRGSQTANHYDHVHVSFEPTAPVTVPVPPKPTFPLPEVPTLSPSAFRVVHGGLDWVFDGPSRVFWPTGTNAQLKFLDALGVKERGPVEDSVFDMLAAFANQWDEPR